MGVSVGVFCSYCWMDYLDWRSVESLAGEVEHCGRVEIN